MSVEVLAKSADNTAARTEMRRRGIDCASPWLLTLLQKMRLIRGVSVGDPKKSWDVLRTLQFVEQHVGNTEPILDLGAYRSEVLLGLHKLGYCDLTGIDLNPALPNMPLSHIIRYVPGDFTHTSFAPESFRAITAISVIEHGFCISKLFREVSRILKTGGFFVGSTDYWPDKIETTGIKAFGMEWIIFSKPELRYAIQEARNYGLVPVGTLNFEASERTVTWLKREYTFAWFALTKLSPDVR